MPKKENIANILVIDNDEGVLAAIVARLERMGCHCVDAVSGAQGLDAFMGNEIDLVITDMNMPAMDGLGLIRQIQEVRAVPIIIITGFKKAYSDELDSLTGVHVMEKPFHTQDLLDVVETEIFLRNSKNSMSEH